MAAVHFLWSLSNDTPMLNHSTRICRSQGFCDNCCHSCHRVVADCVSMLNGLQEPLHPSCNRATLIVFESLITNSLKAQRFFNYFKKLKKRWGKLMKHLAIREGENFFCLREIMFCEGVFVFREGVFCEGGKRLQDYALCSFLISSTFAPNYKRVKNGYSRTKVH